MKVIHVISKITEEAAGPSYSVPRLCESLIDNHVDLELITLNENNSPFHLPYLKKFPFGIGPKRLGISPKMKKWLHHEVKSGRVNIIHNHGLWMMPNVYPFSAIGGYKCPLIVSPRGTLSKYALNRSALQKKIFWYLYQRSVLRGAKCFHATAESEYQDIRRLGFKQPVCILPNGIDVPELFEKIKDDRRQLLFLGRIHPIKGIDNLLRAWAAVEKKFPKWDLHIAGPDNDGYLVEMKALAIELKLARVIFVGPIYGKEKLQAYREADLYILPSRSENFGMTVAESLAAGTPAIVSTGAPWQGLQSEGAGWWVDIGVQPLIACLEETLSLTPYALSLKANAGRDWMLREFSWQKIGIQFSEVYRWLIEGGETPSCIRLD